MNGEPGVGFLVQAESERERERASERGNGLSGALEPKLSSEVFCPSLLFAADLAVSRSVRNNANGAVPTIAATCAAKVGRKTVRNKTRDSNANYDELVWSNAKR
jgi:hypothetical protein